VHSHACERDGEVVAAARALVRTLESVGQDIHALAERMEKPNGSSLTDAEMRKLYDAGYEAGVQAVESKYHGWRFPQRRRYTVVA
jgi:hypothetical protein